MTFYDEAYQFPRCQLLNIKGYNFHSFSNFSTLQFPLLFRINDYGTIQSGRWYLVPLSILGLIYPNLEAVYPCVAIGFSSLSQSFQFQFFETLFPISVCETTHGRVPSQERITSSHLLRKDVCFLDSSFSFTL